MRITKLCLIATLLLPLTLNQEYNCARMVEKVDKACLYDLECQSLAVAMYYEARGDGTKGMVGVANVVLNRLYSEKYPDTIVEVVHQPSQFSFMDRKEFIIEDKKMFDKALHLAYSIMYVKDVKDTTNGATHFLNRKDLTKTPKWVYSSKRVAKIGKHTFYKPKPQRRNT